MSTIDTIVNALLRSRLQTDEYETLRDSHWAVNGSRVATVQRVVSSSSETFGVAPTNTYASGMTDLRILQRMEHQLNRTRVDAQRQMTHLPADTVLTVMMFNVDVTGDDIVVYNGERYRPAIRGLHRVREAYTLSGASLDISGDGLYDPMILGCGLSVKPSTAITFTLTLTDITGTEYTSDEITFAADCTLESYSIVTVDGGRVVIAEVTGATLIDGTVGNGEVLLSPDIPFVCEMNLRRLT